VFESSITITRVPDIDLVSATRALSGCAVEKCVSILPQKRGLRASAPKAVTTTMPLLDYRLKPTGFFPFTGSYELSKLSWTIA